MTRAALLLLFSACAAPDGTAVDQARPPGPSGATLTGPSSVISGETVELRVTASDLAAGDVVEFGSGTAQGSGMCPHRVQTGGGPCMAITGDTTLLGRATATADATNPPNNVAILELPLTALEPVRYLQAFVSRGSLSATTNVIEVDVTQPYNALAPQLAAMATRIDDLEAALDAEIAAREAADATLAGDIASEATTRAANDATLTNNLNALAPSVTAVSANTTLTDAYATVYASAAGGSITLTLPTAAGRSGKTFTIVRSDSTPANVVTVASTGGQLLGNGNVGTSTGLFYISESITLQSTGGGWAFLSGGPQRTFGFQIGQAGGATCAGTSSDLTNAVASYSGAPPDCEVQIRAGYCKTTPVCAAMGRQSWAIVGSGYGNVGASGGFTSATHSAWHQGLPGWGGYAYNGVPSEATCTCTR